MKKNAAYKPRPGGRSDGRRSMSRAAWERRQDEYWQNRRPSRRLLEPGEDPRDAAPDVNPFTSRAKRAASASA